jgi:hypothetical protein
VTLLTQQTTTRTTPAGTHQRLVYDVYADPGGLAAQARRAANNKAKQSRDGAITVQVTHIEDLQE